MSIHKIVITGGPCGGKTTGMSRIANYFTTRGYTTLFIPETATELISGGIAPWTCPDNLDYQLCQMRMQIEKEKIFEEAASAMDKAGKKVLLVCDRGAMDNRAYMNDEEFSKVLLSLGMNEVVLRDSYDAVFHLVTAAKGAEQYYTTDNNVARIETPEQARKLDDSIISAWTGHPHFRIIDNSTDFDGKMKNLIKEISAFLGAPLPYEIERKFLIEYPDIQQLITLPNCRKVEINQIYLKTNPGEEWRIRQRGDNGCYLYYETRKTYVGMANRLDVERRLTKEEYLRLMMNADPESRPIRKTRYCLTYDNQYFEIDVYPFWSDFAVLEIDLSNEDEEVHLPTQFKMIREVTGEREYKNAFLAKKFVKK